jgi:bile acid-coenzyme A ligase
VASTTIGQAFVWLADQDPGAVAVRVVGSGGGAGVDEVVTRAELERESNRVARAWTAADLGVDDVVAVALPPGLPLVIACVAAWKAGASVLPVPPGMAPTAREALLAAADPALLVDGPGDLVRADDDSPLPPAAASSWRWSAATGRAGRPVPVRSGEPATVDPASPYAPFAPHHAVQLVAGPLTRSGPFTHAVRGLMTGHELVVMERFDAEQWLRLVGEHRVTWAVLVPGQMQRIIDVPGRAERDVSSLSAVLHLGARCPEPLKRAWLAWLGPERVLELYAGTASRGHVLVTGREWLAHPGTVGRAAGDTELRVLRPDGSACEPEETGEVQLRRTGPASPDAAWETLGDSGHLDAEGFLVVGDRVDELVRTGGAVVAPTDVEAVIDAHPAVGASVVVGRPDADLGQRVHAVVECHGVGLDELAWWVRQRLDPALHPHTWELVTTPLADETGTVRRAPWREPG